MAMQYIMFWGFLFYGLIVGAGNLFGNAPSWQSRWAYGFTFMACLLLLAHILQYL